MKKKIIFWAVAIALLALLIAIVFKAPMFCIGVVIGWIAKMLIDKYVKE